MTEGTSGPQPSRWTRHAPWAVTALAILWGGWGWGKYFVLCIHATFAAEQTSMFEEMRIASLVPGSRITACDALEETVSYYPTGTKQATGSQLGKVVERHRQAVVRELLSRLRDTSEEDFGDDPQAWIENFCSKPQPSSVHLGI